MDEKARMKEIGAIALRELDDGREISAVRMMFTWRLCIGPAGESTIDDFYCYGDMGEVLNACLSWDGEGDPPGRWHRHGRSARRREFDLKTGEIVREWIQP